MQCRSLPVGLFHKDLLLDFTVTNDSGNSLAVASRLVETRVALAFALSALGKVECEPDPFMLRELQGFISSQRNSEEDSANGLLKELADDERATTNGKVWVARAGASPRFMATVDILRDHHIVIADVPIESNSAVIKIDRHELVPSPSFANQESLRFAATRVEIPDFGWAVSDHVRLFAPSGTRDTDVLAIPVEEGRTLSYQSSSAPGRTSIYRFNSSGETHPMHVRIVGLLRPSAVYREWAALAIMGLMAIALVGGGFWEMLSLALACNTTPWANFPSLWMGSSFGCHGPLWDKDNTEPIVTLTSLIATFFVGFAFRQDEHSVRAFLLERWRRIVFMALSLPWLAGCILLAPRSQISEWVLWGAWLVLGLAMATILIWLLIPAYRSYREEERSTQSVPVSVTVEEVDTHVD